MSGKIVLRTAACAVVACASIACGMGVGTEMDEVHTEDGELWHDPETGTDYVMNPGRRVVLGPDLAAAAQRGEVGQITQAISAGGMDTDWSGRVQVQIVECAAGPQSGVISMGCTLSPEFVLVGGGAEVRWSGRGAMLWESRPVASASAWLASSKDHLFSASHILHVWAVGLRLTRTDGTFMPPDELKAHVFYQQVTSAAAHHPTAGCVVPVGTLLIGGGARSNWDLTGGPGQLLTRSFPENATTWRGSSKDHVFSNPATLDVYCIGIETTLPDVGSLVIEHLTTENFASMRTVGFASSTIGHTPRSVPACYGGDSTWSLGWGRMLFRMAPGDFDIRTFSAATKDHDHPDSGYTRAWATQVRLN